MSPVKKLEDLSIRALFCEIIQRLLPDLLNTAGNKERFCRGKYKNQAKLGVSLSSLENRQSLRDQVRKELIYVTNHDVRAKLLQCLGQEENQIGLSSLIEVTLEDSFNEFSLLILGDDNPFDDQLLPTIARYCTSTSGLSTTFGGSTSLALNGMCNHVPRMLESSLNYLNQITSLSFSKLPVLCKPIVFLLGRFCPLLQILRINSPVEKYLPIELVQIFYSGDIGRLEDVAPLSSGDFGQRRAYHRCHVSHRALHPFHRTLKVVNISCYRTVEPFASAFVLRHLPNLEELKTSDVDFTDCSTSIRALWAISDSTIPVSTIRCLEPHILIPNREADCSILEKHPDLIIPSFFSGTLSLVDNYIEGEVDSETLSAICELCVNIKKLSLLEARIRTQDLNSEYFSENKIIVNFSRLKSLRKFTSIDSDGLLTMVIMKGIGPFLTTLELSLDGDLVPKFDFLVDCVNLEVLSLTPEFHPPLKNYFTQPIDRQHFLPKLKEVRLEFCMNAELEELFLKKTSLEKIDILCLHHLGKNDEELFHLFFQWSQLTSFKYKMPRKFNIDLIFKLLPHLPHLISLSLYKDIKYHSDFFRLKKGCRDRLIELHLHRYLDTYLCINGDIIDELLSTSDESGTET